MSKYYGESERLLGNVFSLANELPDGAIIFLDEVFGLTFIIYSSTSKVKTDIDMIEICNLNNGCCISTSPNRYIIDQYDAYVPCTKTALIFLTCYLVRLGKGWYTPWHLLVWDDTR